MKYFPIKKIFNLICTLITIFYFINISIFDNYGLPEGKLYKTLQFETMQIKILGNDGNATGGGFLRIEMVNSEENKLLYFNGNGEIIPSITTVEYIDKNSINVNGRILKIKETVIIR